MYVNTLKPLFSFCLFIYFILSVVKMNSRIRDVTIKKITDYISFGVKKVSSFQFLSI